ncbi:GNAT family N-acetyltransferase [Vibrio tapetis subsp. quintayensis]|uniref:GNAT family N-acetyltransferase n=1 Tax=Vibrio tapetis TaxID=52443 RepID=UPI0025B579A6|nr:GNAT family N-acetyltransferase [Vibrio tapetis]MDN3678825.1 GNAT family N-acetyltransferase [Vibrio tapetis subsp. quintayensis]
MKVVQADISYEDEYESYVKTCHEASLDYYDLAIDDPKAFLGQLVKNAEGIDLPESWVPCSTYFCIANGEILGSIRIRHGANDFIDNVIGHIGYETKPQSRGKGVAHKMLSFIASNVLDFTAYLICDRSNIASQKVIEKSGASFDAVLVNGSDELLRFTLNRT